MKRFFLIVCACSCVIAVGCSEISNLRMSKSERIRAQIQDVLDGQDSTVMKLMKIEDLQRDLAAAYIDENEPDRAIEMLRDLIRKNREPRNFMYERIPMSAAHYGMESIYYKRLAMAYELKKDKANQDKALKKSAAAEAIDAKLQSR